LLSRLSYPLRSIWQDESNQGQRVRRTLAFLGWQAWKRTLHRPIQVKLFNGFSVRVWPDCDTSPSALYYSLPNSKPISFLRRHLSGGTFVDVGASMGLISLLVADKVEHAILFEPNPTQADRARNNLRLNNLNFEVVAQALSDTVGAIELEYGRTAGSCNRTVEGFATSAPTIPVQRTTLDQFLQQHPELAFPISAVKIDVEGHENSVLRGMRGFLRKQRPKLIMFEYLQRTKIQQTLSIFEDVGYSVFELASAGPRAISEHVSPLQDLFACPVELAAQFGLSAPALVEHTHQ